MLEDVELHDDGSATVGSASDPTRRYEIREGVCSCQDYARAPEHLCQHRLAAGLVRKAQELLAAPVPVELDLVPEPFPANDDEPVPPAPPEEPALAPAPLPEAPASVNCHLTIGGRQV